MPLAREEQRQGTLGCIFCLASLQQIHMEGLQQIHMESLQQIHMEGLQQIHMEVHVKTSNFFSSYKYFKQSPEYVTSEMRT